MEAFRKLGVATALRDAGLPPDYPNDVAYRTTFTGDELSRIPVPARKDRFTATGGPDTWWPTPEPPHRINRIYLGPSCSASLQQRPTSTYSRRVEATDVEHSVDGVRARARDLRRGAMSTSGAIT